MIFGSLNAKIVVNLKTELVCALQMSKEEPVFEEALAKI